MDTAMTSSQPHNWEVLAHLALCSQSDVAHLDLVAFTHRLTDLLQYHLDLPWGMLVVTEYGQVSARSCWGVNSETWIEKSPELSIGNESHTHPFLRLSLRAGSEEVGYLLLAHNSDTPDQPDSLFYTALAAQLGIILADYRQRSANRDMPLPPAGCCNQHPLLVELIHEQKQQLGLLQRVSATAATSLEKRHIYASVVETITQTLGGSYAVLVIYDRKKGLAPVAAVYPANDGDVPAPHPITGNPVVDWLDTHQRPFVSYEIFNDLLLAQFHETFQEHSVASVVFIPLIINGEILGYVEIDFTKAQTHISAQKLETCQAIAYQASREIENTRLYSQAESNAHALQVKVGELSTLLEAARILGSLLQPDEVLNNLMDLVSRQLAVSTVALWTIDNGNELRPIAMDGIPMDMSATMHVPVGKGFTGKVAETGLPLIVNDVEEAGTSFYPDFNRRHRLVSFMGVPVFYRERIVGVLSVMSNTRREFSTDEMMLLVGLAGQAAIALENARLFQDRERRISELITINRISSAVNATLELDEMLVVLHNGISEVLDTTHSFLGIYDVGTTGESPILRQRVVRDGDTASLSDATITLDGKGLLDYVVLESKTLLFHTSEEIAAFQGHNIGWIIRQTPDTNDDMSHHLSIQPQSWLGVPILLGNNILGLINVQSTKPYAFSEDDQRFLSTVASQAAVAMSNARLFQERERRLREITVLKDIGGAISSTLDLQGVLERLYHELGQAIDMSTSLIALYDEHTNMLSYPICYDQGARLYFDPSHLAEDDSSAWAIRNRQPLLLNTLEQGLRMGFSSFGVSVFDLRSGQSKIRHPRSRPFQSFLVVPIFSSEAVLGVINIKSYKSYAFDDDDLRLLTTVANQLAVTISNVHLFQERERRIQELATFNEIGQELSATVSYDELPSLIYRQASRLLDTTNFYMALFDEASGQISFPLFYEQCELRRMDQMIVLEHGKVNRKKAPINHGLYLFLVYLTRRVIHRREPLLLQGKELENSGWDIELREEMGAHDVSFHRPRSWLGAPMIVSDKVIGIICIQNHENEKAFGAYDVRLLSTIASWAAIALENGRLFDQITNLATSLEQRVTERTKELEKANTDLIQEKEYLETVHAITLELTATLDLDEIINKALQMASNNLGVGRGSIMLRELQTGKLICRAVLHERGEVHTTEMPISFGSGEGLAGWVMQHKEAVRLDDVRLDARWIAEAGRAEDVRSFAAAPLMTGDTTLGVLLLSSPETNYFSDSQIRLLATIANEVAIAINNAQLYSYITEMATRLADLLEQQKEENSKSRAILQSLTEGVIVLDTDQRIQLINMAAEEILNMPVQDVLEQHINTLAVHGKTDRECKRSRLLYNTLESGLQKVREGQTIHNMAIEFPQSQTVAVNMAPVVGFDERIYGSVAVLRDITREIEADRAKREFISKVSHELRTPLTSVKGYVDLLLLGSMGSLNQDQVMFLNVIKTNANRLMDLINDILDISRIESGKIKLSYDQVSLCDIISDVIQSLRLESDAKHLSVAVDIPNDLPTFSADPRRLTQVVFNLFSNAVKYTYEGGRIAVRAFLNPAHMIQVEVEDTGVGMSPEQLEKLFRPFYRADNPLRDQAGGTGLGLSIAKSLIDQHGGEMWVGSEIGRGSTFSFILPLVQPAKNSEEDGDDE